MAITVGSVQVEVVPDASTFAEKLRVRLAGIGVTIGVDIDTTAARAALDEVARDRRATIQVGADTTLANAEIDRAARDRTSTIRVNEVGGGGGGGRLLTNPAVIGGAALLGGGVLATAPAVIGAAGAGLAALAGSALAAKLGFDGVGNAIKAVSAAQKASSQSAVAAGAAQAALANTIANAENGAVSASRAVANARRAVGDATRSASQAVNASLRSAVAAEQTLAAAKRSSLDAERALSDAREAARRQLEDFVTATKDGALAERQATLDVQKAQQDLARSRIDPTLTRTERDQAQLTYDQAVRRAEDLKARNTRLSTDKVAADKAGVSGSGAVVAATAALANAQLRVKDAQSAQILTAQQVTEARRAGAQSVARAEQGVSDAIRAQSAQARNSAFQIAEAQRAIQRAAGSASAASLAQAAALAALSPAGRAFVQFYESELRPRLATLRATAQAGLLPGVQAGVIAALPAFGLLNGIVRTVAGALGSLAKTAGTALQSPFWQGFLALIRDNIGPAIDTAGRIVGNFVTGFAGLFAAFVPDAKTFGDGLLGISQRFADFGKTLQSNPQFQLFVKFLRDNGPNIAFVMGTLAKYLFDAALAFTVLSVAAFKVIAVFLRVIGAIRDAEVRIVAFALKIGPDGLVGLIARLASAVPGIGTAVSTVVRLVGGAIGFVSRNFDSIVATVTGLPGRISKAAVGMFDGIKDAFKSAINYVIDGWNGLDFTLPAVDTRIPGIGKLGGFTLGTPDIPRLATGGIVPNTPGGQLIIAGDGREPEAVIPLSRLLDFANQVGSRAFAGSNALAGNGGVTVQQVINNPIPERASVSAAAGMRRAALALGR